MLRTELAELMIHGFQAHSIELGFKSLLKFMDKVSDAG